MLSYRSGHLVAAPYLAFCLYRAVWIDRVAMLACINATGVATFQV
jgi:hypothetical protein